MAGKVGGERQAKPKAKLVRLDWAAKRSAVQGKSANETPGKRGWDGE